MSNPQSLRKEFCEITGANDSKAEQFLKYANWDMQVRYQECLTDIEGGCRKVF